MIESQLIDKPQNSPLYPFAGIERKRRIGNHESRKKREVVPVTVCIATISQLESDGVQYPMIIGATDRMLTAGDIEFEPAQTKVFLFTNRVVALVAGDASFQIAVCSDAGLELRDNQNVDVKTVAETYSRAFVRYRREQAELRYLSPLGLDLQSFIQNQKHMSQETIDNLIYKLEHSKIRAQTIITGTDMDGTAHIYTVKDPGTVSCEDAVGFAAIGIGEWHADSFFMFNRYNKYRFLSEALFLTYAAKRRAEVAPGVGIETDMFVIDSTATQPTSAYTAASLEVIDKLKITYENYISGMGINLRTSLADIDEYITELFDQQQHTQQDNAPDSDISQTVN